MRSAWKRNEGAGPIQADARKGFGSRLGTGRYAARSKVFWARYFLRRVLLSVPLELYVVLKVTTL